MPKIPDYDAASNIANDGYVLGVQSEVVVRFPAETFKGATGNTGAAGVNGTNGANGSPGAVVAYYLQQNFGGL